MHGPTYVKVRGPKEFRRCYEFIMFGIEQITPFRRRNGDRVDQRSAVAWNAAVVMNGTKWAFRAGNSMKPKPIDSMKPNGLSNYSK